MSGLEIKNLQLRFGGVHAVNNLSLSVQPNEFVGLMGPNGAGKTSVINCISRIYPVDDGEITFENQNILKLYPHELGRLGIARTFQDLSFFSRIEDMSVLDYLKVAQFSQHPKNFLKDGFQFRSSQKNEDEIRNRARQILEFFREMREAAEPPEEERGYPMLYGRGGAPDLLDMEYQPIRSLSFAWRRRLDLARALVSRPKLLLLDEPTQGLPPSEIENLVKLLTQIKSEFKISAIIVEHNIAMLMKISDKVVAMSAGAKIIEGTPQEVNQNDIVSKLYLGDKKNLNLLETPTSNKDQKSKNPLLEVKNIDHFYGQAQALYSVSIQLRPQQIACILGTNGSGKSTLLKAISGVEQYTFGQILINGEYLPSGWPEIAVQRGIQYVPQGHVIFPRLTVRQNLEIGSFSTAQRGLKSDFDRVFQYFPDLAKYLDRQANDLSGGQQQMLAIGQALLGKPNVLLLDEPSLGLSPKMVDLLFNIIHKICNEEKCSILLVEQDVKRSLEISDYVYMMSSGVVISEGSSHIYRENDQLVKKNLGFQ